MAATGQTGTQILRRIRTRLRAGGRWLRRWLSPLDRSRLSLGETANLLGLNLDGRAGHPCLPVLPLGLVRLDVVDIVEARIERTGGVVGITEWVQPHGLCLDHLPLLLGRSLQIGFAAGELGQHLRAPARPLLFTTGCKSHTAVNRTKNWTEQYSGGINTQCHF